jgi:ADP-ribosylglycohydrolase
MSSLTSQARLASQVRLVLYTAAVMLLASRTQAAVIAAARYGGDTDTLACMTGALAGALHGPAWLPGDWCGAPPRTARETVTCRLPSL